jgi:hypothetical protein
VHSPGRFWRRFLRDLNRGWEATYYDYKVLPRIDNWSWHFWREAPQTPSVHVLTGLDDWRHAAWTLASFFYFSEFSWPVVIHDDGTLPEEGRATLQKLFTTARVISRAEADATIVPLLQAFPFCADYRRMHPPALKVFDVPHYATNERFVLFDSGLLFFNHPREILDWVAGQSDECWFHEDAAEHSLITAAEARTELEVKIWPRVHSGLSLLSKAAIDLDLCDRALAQTSIPRGEAGHVAQTLLMLCAARHGKGGLLPPRYEVSLAKKTAEDAVSRLYVGETRERFFADGLKRLEPVLLSRDEK